MTTELIEETKIETLNKAQLIDLVNEMKEQHAIGIQNFENTMHSSRETIQEQQAKYEEHVGNLNNIIKATEAFYSDREKGLLKIIEGVQALITAGQGGE